jgi:hypothetical protein
MDSLLQESTNDYEKTKYAELSGQFPAMSHELKKLIVKITNPTNTNLTRISAEGCIANNEEMAYFCSTVIMCAQRMNYSINSLYFSKIEIDDIGMTHIVEIFKHMPTIQTLSMKHCAIKDSSISILAHTINTNIFFHTLEYLFLDFNDITHIGFKELFKELKYTTVINTLDISGNPLYSNFVEMIKQFINDKKTLNMVVISNTHITQNEWTEIVELYMSKQRKNVYYRY